MQAQSDVANDYSNVCGTDNVCNVTHKGNKGMCA